MMFVPSSRLEKAFIYGACLPALALALALDFKGAADVAPLLKYVADGLYYTAIGGIGLLFIRAFRRWRFVSFSALNIFVLANIALEITSYVFRSETGSNLSFEDLKYTAENWQGAIEVARSLVSVKTVTAAIVALMVATTPWAIAFALDRRAKHRHQATELTLPIRPKASFLAMLPLIALIIVPDRAQTNFVLFVESMLATLHATATASTNVKEVELVHSLTFHGERPYKNVVYIMLESTRADVMTTYGGIFGITPFLDEMAKDSVVVQRAYSPVTHTSKAITTILCGVSSYPSSFIKEAMPSAIPANCLPKLLSNGGYRTAYFQSARETFEMRRQHMNNVGFQEFYPGNEINEGLEQINYFGHDDESLVRATEKWLKSLDPNRPFMAAYLTVGTHHPYTLPSHVKETKSYVKLKTYNDYLNTVRYQDAILQRIMNLYEQNGKSDDTLFVFVGDHGEAFGEHKLFAHNVILYEEGVRIPLLFYGKDIKNRLKAPDVNVQQQDILPTVVDLIGSSVPKTAYEGLPISEIPENRPVFFNCFYSNQCTGALIGRKKYLFNRTSAARVYDLDQDPGESTPSQSIGNEDEVAAAIKSWINTTRSRWDNFHDRTDIDALKPGTGFGNVNLAGKDLSNKDLNSVRMDGANLTQADLSYTNISMSQFSGTLLAEAKLIGTKFDGTYLKSVNLMGANLSEASFNRTSGKFVMAIKANFANAKFVRSSLTHSTFGVTDFSGADLTDAKFDKSSFLKAKFGKAILTRTSMKMANLAGADMSEAICQEANLEGVRIDAETKLSASCAALIKQADPKSSEESGRPSPTP